MVTGGVCLCPRSWVGAAPPGRRRKRLALHGARRSWASHLPDSGRARRASAASCPEGLRRPSMANASPLHLATPLARRHTLELPVAFFEPWRVHRLRFWVTIELAVSRAAWATPGGHSSGEERAMRQR